MAEFNMNSFATILFTLTWNSESGTHEENFLGRKVNAWRDFLPEELKQRLVGAKAGETVTVNFHAGTEIPKYDPAKVKKISRRKFKLRSHQFKNYPARMGRFYPQGAVEGLPGVYPQTAIPFRVTGTTDSEIIADLNHPLAKIPFKLEAKLLNVADKDSETGGRLTHWLEELCCWGPGMQAPLENCRTDFIHKDFFRRDNCASDFEFYDKPRLVNHIDQQASANLQSIYTRFLTSEMKVLDLMSSIQSHLPEGMDITGVGMNMDELRMNPALKDRIVQDLNKEHEFNFAAGSFDAVVCSLSIEYLTNPLAVLKRAYKMLTPDGILLIGVSNRWFPPKVTQGWLEMHEFERMGYLLQLAADAGFKGPKGTVSVRNDWRPTTDKHFVATRGVSDPVYVVWCNK
ncbi:methyltransferase domain-containing protein [Maridesulfovibrio sp.]|uniref:methyltransferase domain-containing protein n=1 Tax=Maridesulfovibrio sp. TaxID=2795000 RepID=UPI0039EFF579